MNDTEFKQLKLQHLLDENNKIVKAREELIERYERINNYLQDIFKFKLIRRSMLPISETDEEYKYDSTKGYREELNQIKEQLGYLCIEQYKIYKEMMKIYG